MTNLSSFDRVWLAKMRFDRVIFQVLIELVWLAKMRLHDLYPNSINNISTCSFQWTVTSWFGAPFTQQIFVVNYGKLVVFVRETYICWYTVLYSNISASTEYLHILLSRRIKGEVQGNMTKRKSTRDGHSLWKKKEREREKKTNISTYVDWICSYVAMKTY